MDEDIRFHGTLVSPEGLETVAWLAEGGPVPVHAWISPGTTVTLREVTRENWRTCIRLKVDAPAAALYHALGFRETGEVEQGESVVELREGPE